MQHDKVLKRILKNEGIQTIFNFWQQTKSEHKIWIFIFLYLAALKRPLVKCTGGMQLKASRWMNVFLSGLAPCPESWNVKCDGQQSIYISECEGGIQRAQIEVIEWLCQQRALWRQKSTRMIPVCVCGDILIVTLRWKVDLIKQTKGASKKCMWKAHNDICAHGISSVCLWVSADLCSNCPSKECFLFHSSYVSNFLHLV